MSYPSSYGNTAAAGGGEFNDDAALARALQEEYEKEYRRRSLQQHLGGSSGGGNGPSAPPEEVFGEAFYNEPQASAPPRRITPTPRSPPPRPPQFIEYGRRSAEPVIDSFGSVEVSDEAYARRLELEIHEEEREREQARSLAMARRSAAASAPRTSTTTTTSRARSSSRTRSHSRSRSNNPGRSRSTSRTGNSARPSAAPYASSSSRQMSGARSSSRTRVEQQQQRRSSRSMNHATTTAVATATAVPIATATAVPTSFYLSDAELAQRVEQEERDAELAREYIAQEQEMQRNAARVAAIERKRCCTCRRITSCVLTMSMVTAAVVLVLYFFVWNTEGDNWWNDPNIFGGEDPFNNANPADANLWITQGKGLELTVINALDANWSPYFYQSIQQWDDGVPDALLLTTQEVTPESQCETRRGVMKVCNGNYGATQWRGINKVLLENGWIYASAARMNEYYFKEGDSDQRAYTMCHEIGHGFGLPHTDEDFTNKDLGNCMDYTNRPANNKQPAEPNFLFLAQLYGTIDGSPVPDSSTVETAAAVNKDENESEDDENEEPDEEKGGGRKKKDGDRRNLSPTDLPPSVSAALQDIDLMIDRGLAGTENDGWRKLHESPHGEAHEVELGDGFTVQLHLLKAQE